RATSLTSGYPFRPDGRGRPSPAMTNAPPHPPRRRSLSLAALVAVAAALGTACDVTSATEDPSPEPTLMAARDLDEPSPAVRAPRPPSVPGVDDPVSEPVAVAADLLASSAAAGPGTPEIDRLALSDDLRMAWVLVDALAVAPADRVSDVVRGLATLT